MDDLPVAPGLAEWDANWGIVVAGIGIAASLVMELTDERLREIARFSGKYAPEPPEAVEFIEAHFGIVLPATLKRILRLGPDGSMMVPLKDGLRSCDLHNLRVRTFDDYGSDFLAAYELMHSDLTESREFFRRVIPFGQDGGGGHFCLDYRVPGEPRIALFNWEYELLARSFDEFIDRALPERKAHWSRAPQAISRAEQKAFNAGRPENW